MSKGGEAMDAVLIVEPGEDFRLELIRTFQKDYRVLSCGDGDSAMALLQQHRPEILILSLLLPGMDGLTFLEEAGDLRPPLILCTTVHAADYVLHAAHDLGVGYIMRKPCPVRAIWNRVKDMERLQNMPPPVNPRSVIKYHLTRLGYPPHRSGTQQLLAGVPLYAQDPSQLLSKELYPAIASVCGHKGNKSVEYSIRAVTEDTWNHRVEAVWQEYFPNHTQCPTNKEVLARLADFLMDT